MYPSFTPQQVDKLNDEIREFMESKGINDYFVCVLTKQGAFTDIYADEEEPGFTVLKALHNTADAIFKQLKFMDDNAQAQKN